MVQIALQLLTFDPDQADLSRACSLHNGIGRAMCIPSAVQGHRLRFESRSGVRLVLGRGRTESFYTTPLRLRLAFGDGSSTIPLSHPDREAAACSSISHSAQHSYTNEQPRLPQKIRVY